MKFKFLYSIFALLLIFSCNVNDDNNTAGEDEVSVIYEWHLINVAGGVAGVNHDFDLDTVVWIFNVDYSGSVTLSVENNNTDDTLEDGLDTGTYTVSIPDYDSQAYVFIDGDEYGELTTPSPEDLIINQNNTTEGPGSDGFVYTFTRVVVAAETE